MDRISDYDTVKGTCEDELTLKGSRFIGIVMPCPDESCIQENLSKVMERYRDATHYCYAATRPYTTAPRGRRGPATTGNPQAPPGSPYFSPSKGHSYPISCQ